MLPLHAAMYAMLLAAGMSGTLLFSSSLHQYAAFVLISLGFLAQCT